MNLEEIELNSTLIYAGKILNLKVDTVELPDGNVAKREYVEHRGGAAILAIDKDENVYLVKQFRYPYREAIYEIPAGKLELGEEPIITARRELEEETGLVGELRPYGCLYPTPGYTNERLYIFIADNLVESSTHFDDDEFLDVIKIPYNEALELLDNGTIKDAKTAYALLRYDREREKKSK